MGQERHNITRNIYDIQRRKLFKLIGKYYFSDHDLRNLLTGFNLRSSIERVMENTVYNHLLSQGFEVYVGILHASEVDFVTIRDDKQLYVQATYLLGSEELIKREFGTLWNIPANLPKYVVSMDPISGDLPHTQI